MAQIVPLINTLKAQLKVLGKTYSDVALALNLSEASAKGSFLISVLTYNAWRWSVS